MGASGSTHSGGVGAHDNLGATIPEDPVPYRGPQIQYCLINVDAKLSGKIQFMSTTQMITTNIDEYYQTLCQPYTQGFVMQQFQKIPGVQRQAGFASISMSYQGILVKPLNVPTPERWQLRIEKSFLQTHAFVNWGSTQTVAANTTEIQQKVIDVSAQCGRLICIEITGFQQNRNQLFSGVKGVSGVDLFFNMPLHPNPIRYAYQAVNVPITCNMKAGFPSPIIQMETDIIGIYTAWLNQGWKLVEINFDMSQVAQQTGFTTAKMEQNSIWFFEKEESRVNDNTPVWQGCVLEYMHKIQGGFGGTHAKSGWDEVLGQMGQRGWELATMLETPEKRTSGFTLITKILMFFQRPLLAQPPTASGSGGYPPAKGLGASNEPPPPSYDAVVDPGTAPSDPSAPGPPPAGFNVQ